MKASILLLMVCGLFGQEHPEWTAPQAPFRIYGNTYYVGTHGISSVLVTSEAGDVLIDQGMAEALPQVLENIKNLGFRIQDVKLIVNSHVHYDHAGGLAALQRLTGARVVASAWSAEVMTHSGVGRNDPQHGVIRPIELLPHVDVLRDGETFHVGQLALTAHLTPGHTPGGTSWTWKSCEGGRCLNMVYADSLTAVSANGFLFTKSRSYPDALKDFERSFAFLNGVDCDILITPHPEMSDLWGRMAKRQFVDSGACRAYEEHARERLKERLASEAGK